MYIQAAGNQAPLVQPGTHFDGVGAQIKVRARRVEDSDSFELLFRAQNVLQNLHLNKAGSLMQLHWAAVGEDGWEAYSASPKNAPPKNAHPAGDGIALRTNLDENGAARMTFPFGKAPKKIAFVLFVQGYQGEHHNDRRRERKQHWLKAKDQADFTIDMSRAEEMAINAPKVYLDAKHFTEVMARRRILIRETWTGGNIPDSLSLLETLAEGALSGSIAQPGTDFDKLKPGEAEVTVKAQVADCAVEGGFIYLVFHVSGVHHSLHLSGGALAQLHWAVVGDDGWEAMSNCPVEASPYSDGIALRTSLDKDGRAKITFPCKNAPREIAFVVHVQCLASGKEHWLKAPGGDDFSVDLAHSIEVAEIVAPVYPGPERIAELLAKRPFVPQKKESQPDSILQPDTLFDGLGEARMEAEIVIVGGNFIELMFQATGVRRSFNLRGQILMQLHWAAVVEGKWKAPSNPPPDANPSGDGIAFRTNLSDDGAGKIVFPFDLAPQKIGFTLYVESADQTHWLNAWGGVHFTVDIRDAVKVAKIIPEKVNVFSGYYGQVRIARRPKKWPELQDALKKAKAQRKKEIADTNNSDIKVPPISMGERDIEGSGKMMWHVVRDNQRNETALFLEVSRAFPESANVMLRWKGDEGVKLSVAPSNAEYVDETVLQTLVVGQSRTIMRFSHESMPAGITFVLLVQTPAQEQQLKAAAQREQDGKEPEEAGEFAIGLKCDPMKILSAVGKRFVELETKSKWWSQFQRMNLMSEFLEKDDLSAMDAAWITTGLKLAQQKALDLYRDYAYQPKAYMLAQDRIGCLLATTVYSTDQPSIRTLLRLSVGACARGSKNSGDGIRHGILNLMRKHGIKEGHRAGIECHFLEQWHQKLHTNSAPDDIIICEGYLAFLKSGVPEDLFRYVQDHGNITRADLAKMASQGFGYETKSVCRGLNVNPVHLPQVYDDMEQYLGLLKHAHGGASLHDLCKACKGQYPDQDSECMAFDILDNRDNLGIMGRITQLRRKLQPHLWKRDLILLDVALEDHMRSLIERSRPSDLGNDELIRCLTAVLEDLVLSRNEESFIYGLSLIKRLTQEDHGGARPWGMEWCKLMLAATERISASCQISIDQIVTNLQTCADTIYAGSQQPGSFFIPADSAPFESFGEETARCLTERVLAQVLRVLVPKLRRGAGMGPWEIVSRGPGLAVGTVQAMESLLKEQPSGGQVVAVLETLTGWEDIPLGVVAIILPADMSVDVLSHVAIRARNQQVLLASCDDDSALTLLRAASGSVLKLSISATGEVNWTMASQTDLPAKKATNAKPIQIDLAQAPPDPPSKAIGMNQFVVNQRCIGGKSLNLAKLLMFQKADRESFRGESIIHVPPSVTVPFVVFEQVLVDPINKEVREKVSELLEDNEWSEARKMIVDELRIPLGVVLALSAELEEAGNPLPTDSEQWQRALKTVWASKWTDRAVSSRQSVGLFDYQLFLAVLVQPLQGGMFGFVIHTQSPLVGDSKDEALVEVCVGLGESLVSNSPGRALSASVSATAVRIHSYPSKPLGVFLPDGGSLIFRSDSNGEDLPGFAGAGLYDSVSATACPSRPVDYTKSPLLFDKNFQEELLSQLYDIGRRVEYFFDGVPQDVEGAIGPSGAITVTQSRPQV